MCSENKRLYGKMLILEKKIKKEDLVLFQNVNTTVPTVKCIAVCIVHHEGLLVDFERRYNDIIICNM